MLKKTLISIPIIIGLILLSIFLCIKNAMEYNVYDYKPDYLVKNRNEEVLRSRFSAVIVEPCSLFVEWNTYDNEKINEPPYKLFVVVHSNDSNITTVKLDRINILSSMNIKYSLIEKNKVLIYDRTKNENRQAKTFEPAFNFQFKSKEEITLEFIIAITIAGQEMRINKKIKFLPIKVKHLGPVV